MGHNISIEDEITKSRNNRKSHTTSISTTTTAYNSKRSTNTHTPPPLPLPPPPTHITDPTTTTTPTLYMASNYKDIYLSAEVILLIKDLVFEKFDERNNKYWVRFMREYVLQEKRIQFHKLLDTTRKRHNQTMAPSGGGGGVVPIEAIEATKKKIECDVLYSKDWGERVDLIGRNIKDRVRDDESFREEFKTRFEDFIHNSCCARGIYNTYFQVPESLTPDEISPSNSSLPLFLRWSIDLLALNGNSKNSLQIMNDYVKLLRTSGWVVRIILSTINNKDKKEDYTLNDRINQFVSKMVTPYALNHTALQIGPYYIHYTALGVVTFHDVESKDNAYAMLYPDRSFTIDYQNETQLMALCEVIARYNVKEYHSKSMNCHTFVNEALEAINCPPFPKKGPIANFLEMVRSNDTGVNRMGMIDLKGDVVYFESYEDLVKYCKADPIRKIINCHPQERTAEQEHLLQVLRALERGYQIQLPTEKQNPSNSLIFPSQYETSMLQSSVDKITKFQMK